MTERVVDRGALESAMRHAIVATGILADAVIVPFRVLDQRLEGIRIAFVGQQVTGPLPPELVVCRHAPGGALIGLIPREKIQEQSGVVERPGKPPGPVLPTAENASEQLLAGRPSQKHILTRRVVIAVTRGYRDAGYPQLHGGIEELGNVLRILAAEQRAIDRHAEPLLARQLDGGNRLVEDAFLADRFIVPLPVAVQMDGESQIR